MATSHRLHLGAVLFFLALTLAVTWPLALHLADRVPGWYVADNYEYLWKMWWFKHALVDLHTSPLVAPDIFYPQGFALAHGELSPLHTIIALPLTSLLGEVVTYNLFAMLSFVLSGWAAFSLVHRWTGNPWAGLLSGTLFVLTPYHLVRYGGILPSAAVEGIPVFLLGIEVWLSSSRLRGAVVAGVGFLLAAWAYTYYGVGLLMVAPVYILGRVQSIKGSLRDRRNWMPLVLLSGVALAGMGLLAIPYLRLGQEVRLRIPLDEVDFWSASPTDYLIPAGLSPVWGSWVRRMLIGIPAQYDQIALEFVLAPGYLALLFALYGLRSRTPGISRALLLLCLVSAVLSFGPRLHIARRVAALPAPEKVVSSFQRSLDWIGVHLPGGEPYHTLTDGGLTIPLPALFLRWLLPPLQAMRAWNRFAVLAVLAIALLAGIGYAAWIRGLTSSVPPARAKRRAWGAGVIVLAISVLELWPTSIPLQRIEPRPVDLWLAGQPGEFTIMQLPLTSALSAPQMLYTRYHGKRTAFAYGTYFQYWYRDTFPELADCPSEPCVQRLRSWEVHFVLLNLDDTPNGPALEPLLDQAPDFRRVARLANTVVYELLPGPSPAKDP